MKTNATQRSLALLKRGGWNAEVVEKWIPWAKRPGEAGGEDAGGRGIRRDFGNFADILAWRADRPGVLAIQTHPAASLAEHRRKMLTTPEIVEKVRAWLQAGNTFRLEGWGLRGERGCRKLWEAKTEWITLEMLPAAPPPDDFDVIVPLSKSKAPAAAPLLPLGQV